MVLDQAAPSELDKLKFPAVTHIIFNTYSLIRCYWLRGQFAYLFSLEADLFTKKFQSSHEWNIQIYTKIVVIMDGFGNKDGRKETLSTERYMHFVKRNHTHIQYPVIPGSEPVKEIISAF